MKGIGIHEYGNEQQLTIIEADPLDLSSGQVRISLRASGVNPIDWKLREGYLAGALPFEPPLTLGWDGAGTVTEIGQNVTGIQTGDDVFFRPELTENGTYADEIVTEADLVQPLPQGLSYSEAASLPLASLTAIEAFTQIGHLKSGEHVLILGGSGGVGTVAIQIAKALGARVTTTCRAKNADFVHELGADRVVPYDRSDHDFEDEFDMLFDTVGAEAYQGAISSVKTGGTAVSTAGGCGANQEITWVEKERDVYTDNMFMNPDKEKITFLKQLIDRDEVKPVVSHTYPMTVDGAKKAHQDSQSNRTHGKIVLTREHEEDIV